MRGRNPWLDLIRVACLGMVILYHSTFIGPWVYAELAPRHLVFAHQIGASLLLVLSSHLVAASLADPARATARWWFSRAARLLPGFVAGTLLVAAAIDGLAPAGWYRIGVPDLLANLAMLWNWNGVYHLDYIDGSYWTLPLQLGAFAVAPLLRRGRWGHGRRLRVVLWAAVGLPLLQWPLAQAGSPLYDSLVDGFGLYRWHLFVAGVAAWMLGSGRLTPRHGLALLGACVAAHVVQNGTWVPGTGLVTDPWSVAGLALGAGALVLADRAHLRRLRPPAPVEGLVERLAPHAYGIYLVHQSLGYLLMLRLQEAFGTGPGLQTLAMVGQAVLLGAAMTRCVERPAHRMLLRWWDDHAGARRRSAGPLRRYTKAPTPVIERPTTRVLISRVPS